MKQEFNAALASVKGISVRSNNNSFEVVSTGRPVYFYMGSHHVELHVGTIPGYYVGKAVTLKYMSVEKAIAYIERKVAEDDKFAYAQEVRQKNAAMARADYEAKLQAEAARAGCTIDEDGQAVTPSGQTLSVWNWDGEPKVKVTVGGETIRFLSILGAVKLIETLAVGA